MKTYRQRDRGMFGPDEPLDLVYPLKPTNLKDLRYSLRSVETYLTGYRHVIIVGARPDWIRGIRHIPMPDLFGRSPVNTCAKVLAACHTPGLTKRILYMNDDFMFTQHVDARQLLLIYENDLAWAYALRKLHSSLYLQQLEATEQYLQSRGLPTRNYEVHCPMPIERERMKRVMKKMDWARKHPLETARMWRSLYGNKAETHKIAPGCDNKVYPKDTPRDLRTTWFASVSYDQTPPWAIEWMEQTFPVPSRWEVKE